MEAKLAEFRKTHVQKRPLINFNEILRRFKSIFSSSSTNLSETQAQEEDLVEKTN